MPRSRRSAAGPRTRRATTSTATCATTGSPRDRRSSPASSGREGVWHRRVAVLCAEEAPDECHRHLLIARVLVSRGAEVAHLRHDGTDEPFEAAVERRRPGGQQRCSRWRWRGARPGCAGAVSAHTRPERGAERTVAVVVLARTGAAMCRCDPVGDLGKAVLVGGRRAHMTLIAERYGLATGLAVEDLVRLECWLLVEEDRRDGRHWLSDEPSPEQAMSSHTECLHRGDWHVAGVVDLDTGEVILLTKPGDGWVKDAREVAGVAAAVVELFGPGREAVARVAVSSLVDQVLPIDGLLSALAVLELGTEADADMVRAACATGVADAAAWEDDKEPDEVLVERVAARFKVVARDGGGGGARAAHGPARGRELSGRGARRFVTAPSRRASRRVGAAQTGQRAATARSTAAVVRCYAHTSAWRAPSDAGEPPWVPWRPLLLGRKMEPRRRRGSQGSRRHVATRPRRRSRRSASSVSCARRSGPSRALRRGTGQPKRSS